VRQRFHSSQRSSTPTVSASNLHVVNQLAIPQRFKYRIGKAKTRIFEPSLAQIVVDPVNLLFFANLLHHSVENPG